MTDGRKCAKCREPKNRRDFDECGYKDRKSQITPRCKLCRSDDYYSKKCNTICIECLRPRPLDNNQICKKCNELHGLKECKVCKNLLIKLLHFVPGYRTCKECKRNHKNNQTKHLAEHNLTEYANTQM